VPGTEDAKTIEPAADYILPLGKGCVSLAADDTCVENGDSVCVITYGMGVHWATQAAKDFDGQIEVIDIRTIYPLDEDLIYSRVKKHGKCLVLTEEQLNNSFCEALAGRIAQHCFTALDAPVFTMGALNLPAVPMNIHLEAAMLPNAQKVSEQLARILNY
jgi:2-oxoisovalerate dehydrogenase E1 component